MLSENSYIMLPSDMNLLIGKIKNYNNKILISLSSFNIGTNLKINIDDDKHIEKDRPDIKSKKEDKRDIKMMKNEPDMNEITHEEEKAVLILGITSIFAVWWIFKCFIFFSFLS